jgi:hypothetical protein
MNEAETKTIGEKSTTPKICIPIVGGEVLTESRKTIRVVLPELPGGDVLVPVEILLGTIPSQVGTTVIDDIGDVVERFDVVAASCGDDELLASMPSDIVSRRGKARVRLIVKDPPRGSHVDVLVQNRSSSSATFRGTLSCYASEGLEDADTSVEGLLDRCRRWFGNGLAAALEDRKARSTLADRELHNLINREEDTESRQPTQVLENIRFLFALVTSFVAIPFAAAIARWDELQEQIDEGLEEAERRLATIGVGPEILAPGERRAIKIVPQLGFRPTTLLIDPQNGHLFVVEDVRIGKNSQFLTSGSVPGVLFCSQGGLPVGLERAAPGQDITVHVTNSSDKEEIFRGALVGEVDS